MFLEAGQTRCMRFLRSERTDVKAGRGQRRLQRGIVELGIVCQRDERASKSKRLFSQGLVWPCMRNLQSWKTISGGKSCTGINDAHGVAAKLRHLRQRLRNMNGTDDREIER